LKFRINGRTDGQTWGVDHGGCGVRDPPWKYIGEVRICFDP